MNDNTAKTWTFKDILERQEPSPQVCEEVKLSYDEWLKQFRTKREQQIKKKVSKADMLRYDYIDEHYEAIVAAMTHVKSKFEHRGHLARLEYGAFLKLLSNNINVEEVVTPDSHHEGDDEITWNQQDNVGDE